MSLACHTPAYSNETDNLFEMPLSELLNVEVAVSNRNATPVGSTPASVTVYSSDDIQRMGARTLEQLLNFVPGFAIARSDVEGFNKNIGMLF